MIQRRTCYSMQEKKAMGEDSKKSWRSRSFPGADARSFAVLALFLFFYLNSAGSFNTTTAVAAAPALG